MGLMQVNTTSHTDATTLNNLEYDWQYNLQYATDNVFKWAYGEATKYLNGLKLSTPPSADQILEETYFTYNHGHAGTDQYFNDVNGQLVQRVYPLGSQAAQAEKNATNVDGWYKTKPWDDPNGGPRGPLGCVK